MKRILCFALTALLLAFSAACAASDPNDSAATAAEVPALESALPDTGSGTPPELTDGMGAPPELTDGMGTPPALPDGMGTPPALPDGETGERPSGKPDGKGERPSGKPDGAGNPGGKPGGSASDVSYAGAVTVSSADMQENQTYASTTADESALMISTSDAVTITNPTVTKTGDSDGGDNCNFYGLNAAVLVKDGASVTITGGTITSSASGANGVFCYGGNGGSNGAAGDGTTLIIRDTVITTTGDGSGGTAIRTDRGGGTVYVNGGAYTSNGLGSPAIYSTAEIHVANATLVSNLSEGVCIEGKNSIELVDCNLTASNTKCNGNATFFDSIMIYQSMSGDADSGTSSFTMTGGTLTSKNGHVFHVTNTNAIITLTGVTLINEDGENILLSVCADGWSGAGNVATLNAIHEALSGTILVGSDSELTLNLTDGSTFTGAVSGSITNAKGTSVSTDVGTVHVTLDSTSTWTLTADTYVTSFTGDASNVISNGYTLYVNGVALTGTK